MPRVICRLRLSVDPFVLPEHGPCCEGGRGGPGEAATWEPWVRRLLAARIWEVLRPLCASLVCSLGLRGSKELMRALSTCLALMFHKYPVYATYCRRKLLHVVINLHRGGKPCCTLVFFFFFFSFLRFYLFIRERGRGRSRLHAGSPTGLDPGSPGSRPGSKADAKPLSHPGIPYFIF